MSFLAWIVLIGAGAAAGFVWLAYQRAMALDALCDRAGADIGERLMERHALLPEFLDAVRAFTYERDAIETAAKARAAALRASTPQAQLLAEAALSDAVNRVLAVAESSPILRGSRQFAEARKRICDTETELLAARRRLSAAVIAYNRALRRFPLDLVAERLRLVRRAFYDIGVETAG